jgi:hypothetical protein
MAQVPIVALRDPVIPLDARSSTSLAAITASVATNIGTSAQFSDRVEKDLVCAPDVCDYHVRSRVMESLAATEEH